MPLTPRSQGLAQCCRASIRARVVTCADCGADLADSIALVERLTRASATWKGGVVIPMAPFRKLTGATRREVTAAVIRSLEEHEP